MEDRISEDAFTQEMLDLCPQILAITKAYGIKVGDEKGYSYYPHRFRQAVRSKGGVEAIKDLLHRGGKSAGLERIRRCHALEYSIERQVLRDDVRHFFSDEEREIARNRLAAYGYFPKEEE